MSNVCEYVLSQRHDPRSSGAKELIAEYWLRHGKKKSERAGRKSDPKPKAPPRRPVAASVETTPEPASTTTKKRGRGRPKSKVDSDDEGADEEDGRSRKRGRKSNGITRKASPSPASSSDRASESIQTFEPSAIKKWGGLPSWEQHLEDIDTVERTPDGELFIYFKLFVICFSACAMSDRLVMSCRKGEKVPCKENSRICAEKFPHAVRWLAIIFAFSS